MRGGALGGRGVSERDPGCFETGGRVGADTSCAFATAKLVSPCQPDGADEVRGGLGWMGRFGGGFSG